MGIRRGTWINSGDDHSNIIKTSSSGAKPVSPNTSTPVVGLSGNKDVMGKMSDFRRDLFKTGDTENQKHSPTPQLVYSASYRSAQEMKDKFNKTAGVSGVGSSYGRSGGSNTIQQGPEVYSPLFQMANLQLPRDRITMNAWNRNFYDTHPLVHNCINLHATYPISKINIKCKNQKVERFFNEMAEEMDLMGILQSIALEYWKLGEKIDGASLITMADGTLKPISEINIGDVVLTHLGNKKRVIDRFVKPTSTVIEEELKVYKLYVQGIPEPLIISGNHPILSSVRDSFRCTTPSCILKNMRILPGKECCSNCGKKPVIDNQAPVFIKTNEIKNGDIVYSPFNNTVIDDDRFTNDLCYILGFWLAEGSYCKAPRKAYTKYTGVKFTNYDDSFMAAEVLPVFNCAVGDGIKKYTSKATQFSVGKNKYDYWFEGNYKGGPEIAAFFHQHCGEYSKTKKMSDTIMSLPFEKQLNLLAGFIDGDGCVDKSNGHILVCTSSKDLANQFVLMLRRFGAHPTYSKRQSKINGKLVGFNYRISIPANESYDLFKDRLKSDKRNLLRKVKWNSCRSSIYLGSQLLTVEKIEDITELYNESLMYDIEVEDDHSYVANGIAIHNCFPYAQLNQNTGKWNSIVILNPDYVHVKKSPLGDFSLSMRPDAALLRLIQSNNPDDIRLTQQMDPQVVYHVRKGNNIPLDNFHVSHLKMLSSAYDIHGTSIIVSVYKDLMLYDKLRESKFAQADNLVNPITLIKVGGTEEGEYHPSEADLENFRSVFEMAQHDKDFKIITHSGVKVERVGAAGQIIDIAPDMSFILDNIMFGLMVPKNVIIQEGAAFQSASIGLEVLKQRYESFRNMMAQWLIRKVFAPISEVQEFYDYENGEKKLIVPTVDWNHMALYDMDNYINAMKDLAAGEKQTVSKDTLFRSLGLSLEDERRKIKEEMIQNIILQKEVAILQEMSLGALRSLKPDSDVIEQTTLTPLPGTISPESEEAGAMPDLGAGGGSEAPGGLGLGAPSTPPPMPGPSGGTPPAPGGTPAPTL